MFPFKAKWRFVGRVTPVRFVPLFDEVEYRRPSLGLTKAQIHLLFSKSIPSHQGPSLSLPGKLLEDPVGFQNVGPTGPKTEVQVRLTSVGLWGIKKLSTPALDDPGKPLAQAGKGFEKGNVREREIAARYAGSAQVSQLALGSHISISPHPQPVRRAVLSGIRLVLFLFESTRSGGTGGISRPPGGGSGVRNL